MNHTYLLTTGYGHLSACRSQSANSAWVGIQYNQEKTQLVPNSFLRILTGLCAVLYLTIHGKIFPH